MVSHHSSSDDVQLKNSTRLIDGSYFFLYVINSYWLQKLVELRTSKNIGSNEPWDLGHLWKPVLD